MISSNRSGSSGFDRLAGGGESVKMRCTRTAPVSPQNAWRPVTISYSTAPNENKSVRASSGSPRSCSGDMKAAVPIVAPVSVRQSLEDVSVGISGFDPAGRAVSLAKLTARPAGSNPDMPTLTSSSDCLTETGATMGTAAFMSPEQLRGEPLDARTDLFSLGAVLYEMVTGRQAFCGETGAVLVQRILTDSPPPASRSNPLLPERLEEIIGRALEKDRELRYQSAAEMRSELKRLKRD